MLNSKNKQKEPKIRYKIVILCTITNIQLKSDSAKCWKWLSYTAKGGVCLDIGKIWRERVPSQRWKDLYSAPASFPKMSTNRSDTPLITCTKHDEAPAPCEGPKDPNKSIQKMCYLFSNLASFGLTWYPMCNFQDLVPICSHLSFPDSGYSRSTQDCLWMTSEVWCRGHKPLDLQPGSQTK